MGQRSGTLDDGLDDVDELATAYEKCTLLAQELFAKSTCSLAPAPFVFLR